MIQHVTHQWNDIVIGRGPDINDVVAAFESFISRGMPEQPLGAFDDGNDLLARSGGITADDVVDLFFAN